MYNATVTTLIIHPSQEIQRKQAYLLASTLLNIPDQAEVLHSNPDLHLLDGSIGTSIGIDSVRELTRKMQFHPYQSPYQIGLILFAHTLTEEAQNSLLKTLEEPGEKTRYILTTPHERLILPTIRSRCSCMFIKETITVIKKEDSSIDSFLQKDLVEKLLEVEALVEQDKERPGSLTSFIENLTEMFRANLITATREKDRDSMRKNIQALKLIARSSQFLKRNANKRITLENLLLQLEMRIMNAR